MRGSARAAGLPAPELPRMAQPGASRRRPQRRSRVLSGHGCPGEPGSPRAFSPLARTLRGRFPTCRALRLLRDPEAAFGEVIWGLSPSRSLRPGIAGVPGGGRARLGERAQIWGLFGERHVLELTWLCCAEAENTHSHRELANVSGMRNWSSIGLLRACIIYPPLFSAFAALFVLAYIKS